MYCYNLHKNNKNYEFLSGIDSKSKFVIWKTTENTGAGYWDASVRTITPTDAILVSLSC